MLVRKIVKHLNFKPRFAIWFDREDSDYVNKIRKSFETSFVFGSQVLDPEDQIGFILDKNAASSSLLLIFFSDRKFILLLRKYGFIFLKMKWRNYSQFKRTNDPSLKNTSRFVKWNMFKDNSGLQLFDYSQNGHFNWISDVPKLEIEGSSDSIKYIFGNNWNKLLDKDWINDFVSENLYSWKEGIHNVWMFREQLIFDYILEDERQMRDMIGTEFMGNFNFSKQRAIPNILKDSRVFVVAPSGSGKTFYCDKFPDKLVDADKLFKWPMVNRFWENKELALEVNEVNTEILRKWLNGPKDGKIILYAEPLIPAYAAVIIPTIQLKSNLSNNRPGQPDLRDLDGILRARKRLKVRYPYFHSFEDLLHGRPVIYNKISAESMANTVRMAGYCSIYNEFFYDFGQTAPQGMMSLLLGCCCVGVNMEVSTPCSYRDYDHVKWFDGKVNWDEDSIGQAKLFYSDAIFLKMLKGYNKSILSIGGSPGQHFDLLQRLFICEVDVMDPRPVKFKPRAHFIMLADATTKASQYDGVIWDVRRDSPKIKDAQLRKLAYEKQVLEDIYMTRNFITNNPDTPGTYKFRFPREDYISNYIQIDVPTFHNILPEIYSATKSFESRLISLPNTYPMTIRSDIYNKWAKNIIYLRSIGVAEDFLIQHDLRICDYFNLNLKQQNILAMYTLGLNHNRFNDILELLYNNFVICNLMSLHAQFYMHYTQISDYMMVNNGKYYDRLFDVNEILYKLRKKGVLYIGLTVRDFMTMSCFQMGGILRRDMLSANPFNVNSMECEKWFILVHHKFVYHDILTQNWWNSQTHFVKEFTPIMRSLFDLDDHDLHMWRVWATKILYPEAVIFRDIRVNAMIQHKGKDMYLAVAGHPLNMLIATNFKVIDFFRYTRPLVTNILAAQKGDFSYEEEMVSTGMAAERPNIGLWHNFFEYKIAVRTYQLMCEQGLFLLDNYAVKIMEDMLDECSVFPIFFNQSNTATQRVSPPENDEYPINDTIIYWSIDAIAHSCKSKMGLKE